ncbi:MAG TPA: hypothetical protein PLC80_18670, partial [Draconibacterium sp.]|nr:hypothetical protein [Draconibacterium sp.]
FLIFSKVQNFGKAYEYNFKEGEKPGNQSKCWGEYIDNQQRPGFSVFNLCSPLLINHPYLIQLIYQ